MTAWLGPAAEAEKPGLHGLRPKPEHHYFGPPPSVTSVVTASCALKPLLKRATDSTTLLGAGLNGEGTLQELVFDEGADGSDEVCENHKDPELLPRYHHHYPNRGPFTPLPTSTQSHSTSPVSASATGPSPLRSNLSAKLVCKLVCFPSSAHSRLNHPFRNLHTPRSQHSPRLCGAHYFHLYIGDLCIVYLRSRLPTRATTTDNPTSLPRFPTRLARGNPHQISRRSPPPLSPPLPKLIPQNHSDFLASTAPRPSKRWRWGREWEPVHRYAQCQSSTSTTNGASLGLPRLDSLPPASRSAGMQGKGGPASEGVAPCTLRVVAP
ncbi:hypothetical protein C8F04DRAFT_1260048 [Mycena alexandri]|uniref:Uncharacterized protein n=1 Tax=Mycena alexandri TaxID=1745969 RepID=A0AAD6SYX7_9AGAR|nr:hypothetical protein C8F04DRAFT_1260048 [Mycena alexandri]